MSDNIEKFMKDLPGFPMRGAFVKLFRAVGEGEVYPISFIIQKDYGEGEIRIRGNGHGLECIDSVRQALSLDEYGEILISDQWSGVDLKKFVGRNVVDYDVVESMGDVVSVIIRFGPGEINISSKDDELNVLVLL